MTSKPLTREQYELWLKIKDLAKQRADETGVFHMRLPEVSELAGSSMQGQHLIMPLQMHGLIIKLGNTILPGAGGARQIACTWKMPDFVPEVPSSSLPDPKANELAKSQLWNALRQILVHWSSDERSLKDVAASVGHEWTIAYGSKPFGWFLSVSWEELPEHRKIRAQRALSLQKAMCRLAEALNPDAVNAHPTYSRLVEQIDGIPLQQDEDARVWDLAIAKLRSCGKTFLTLGQLADAVGSRRPYSFSDMPLDDILDRSWADFLRCGFNFGGWKQQALLTLVTRAAKDIAAVMKAAQQKASTYRLTDELDARLRALGIASDMPLDFLFLSKMPMWHLRNQGMNDLGAVLGYLAGTDLQTISAFRLLSHSNALELMDLLRAVRELDLDKLREFLPLRAEGKGLGYAAYARLSLREFTPRHRDWLFTHFVLGQKRGDIAIQYDVVSSCVHKHTRLFRQCLEKALAYFPDDGRRLREARERGESLANAINWEMDGTDLATVCGVLDKVLSPATRKKEIPVESQGRVFHLWWRKLKRLPEFRREGVSLSHFLQDRGYPELQAQFIEYLDTRSSAHFNSAQDKVVWLAAKERVTAENQDRFFALWWGRLKRLPEFRREGVSLSQFLRDLGDTELQARFIEYLKAKSSASVSSALDKVVWLAPEKRATTGPRKPMFIAWWKQLQQLPEFAGEGVSLSQFLQDRGHPELQAQFIEYLKAKPSASVSSALDKVVWSAPEKKATAAQRWKMFVAWWKQLRQLPEFALEGVSLSQFLQDRGHPELLPQFVEYLKARPSASVSSELDKVVWSPVKEMVTAENQDRVFGLWWRRLEKHSEFRREGVSLSQFLQYLGHPELLPQFIEYLKAKPSASVSSALDKVVWLAPEKRATAALRRQMFVTWWTQVQQLPEFSGEGVSLSQFLQDRGHPELLAQFIQYLDTRPLAYYCGLTGTVTHIYAYHWSKQ